MNILKKGELELSFSQFASFQALSRYTSLLVILIGSIGLAGWVFDITLFKSIFPGLVVIKANSAVGLIMGGTSLTLWHQRPNTLLSKRAGQFCAFIVLLIGLLTLTQYAMHVNFGIDQFLFKATLDPLHEAAPGRMAVNTALSFLLVGFALVVLHLGSRRTIIVQFLASTIFIIALLGLSGYIYGNAYFYRIGFVTSMALNTALGFLLLSLSILLTRPDQGMMAVFISKQAGGLMAQRLFPAALVIPPIVCWLVLLGYRAKFYTPEMGIGLLSILNIIIFAVLIYWNAQSLNVIDQKRKRTEQELQQMNEQLQREIVERKQAEEEVHQALKKQKELNELKTRFFSMASHDFRTPLTTILASSEMLKYYSHKITDDQKEKHFHKIKKQVNNITTLLDEVLFFGKAESGRMEFNPITLNVEELCRDILSEIELAYEEQNKFIFNYQGEFIIVKMDIQLLRKILINLLSNAVKYSHQGSLICLDLVCEQSQTIFKIKDQGIGIPLSEQSQLFEVFHRASNVGNISGTGLGMAIVKQSVELQGGTITFVSSEGRGTTFTVCIPTA